MSRPWENDVKTSSQKFDFNVQSNGSPSLNVYRDYVMHENDYTAMIKFLYEDDGDGTEAIRDEGGKLERLHKDPQEL